MRPQLLARHRAADTAEPGTNADGASIQKPPGPSGIEAGEAHGAEKKTPWRGWVAETWRGCRGCLAIHWSASAQETQWAPHAAQAA